MRDQDRYSILYQYLLCGHPGSGLWINYRFWIKASQIEMLWCVWCFGAICHLVRWWDMKLLQARTGEGLCLVSSMLHAIQHHRIWPIQVAMTYLIPFLWNCEWAVILLTSLETSKITAGTNDFLPCYGRCFVVYGISMFCYPNANQCPAFSSTIQHIFSILPSESHSGHQVGHVKA